MTPPEPELRLANDQIDVCTIIIQMPSVYSLHLRLVLQINRTSTCISGVGMSQKKWSGENRSTGLKFSVGQTISAEKIGPPPIKMVLA